MLIWMLFMGALTAVKAQVTNEGSRAGTVRANLTFSAGHFFSFKGRGSYLHGFAEYFPERSVSLRGDFFWQLNQTGSNNPLSRHETAFFGAAMHFGRQKKTDFFIAFQPGLSRSNARNTPENNFKWNPMLSLTPGMVFYVNRFFNFFGEARFLAGRFLPNGTTAAYPLEEIRFSLGLGFHFDFIR